MREPKDRICRAKRLDNGEWIVGYYIHYRDMVHQIYCRDVKIKRGETASMFIDVDPKTLGECSGLCIKRSGKDLEKIFEDDILKVSWDAGERQGVVEFYTVEFVHGMFLARQISTGKLVGPVANLAATRNNGEKSNISCSIIGNTVDDAKLIRKLRP